ncbi:MAG: SPFH/Band 7/PHB domain protein [Christensenellaceae bacterium]|jgi:regulator of protease activity HflC (stomatin/prohibitin superfamily)|nr:SPFH/Band 7/PHB domain protein [Christensenellaceae bacterium]
MTSLLLLNGAVVGGIVAACIIFGVLIIGLWMSIRIVPQGSAIIVQRLGKYKRTLETGFNMILPILDRTLPPITLKEQVLDFRPSDVITKDNVKMLIDTIVFAQVVDPKLYTYGIERPMMAIENLTATTLRNILGELDLDGTLTSRDIVNAKMREIIDLATDPWGIKVSRVELKNILPPATIQESMEKQMRAERERREAILRAEGEKRSSILIAEGEKESALLRADARKLATIAEAEGQAQAIERILKAKPDAAYLTLQGFEAVKAMADGQATKIIVPSSLANVSTMFTTMGEMLGTTEKPKSTATPKRKK